MSADVAVYLCHGAFELTEEYFASAPGVPNYGLELVKVTLVPVRIYGKCGQSIHEILSNLLFKLAEVKNQLKKCAVVWFFKIWSRDKRKQI